MFDRRPPVAPVTAADLQAVHESLEKMRSEMAAMNSRGESQGAVLVAMPAAMLTHFEHQIGAIANAVAIHVTKKVAEEAGRHILRYGVGVCVTAVGGYLAVWWSTIAGSLHK